MGNISIRQMKMNFFDDIKVDQSVAKHKTKQQDHFQTGILTNDAISFSGNSMFISTASGGSWSTPLTGSNSVSAPTETIKKKMGEFVGKLFRKKKKHASHVFKLFAAGKSVMREMNVKVQVVERAAKAAEDNFQVALAEKIRQDMAVKLVEDRMILSGFDRCVTENQAVLFFEACDCTPLSLTYLKNYVRPLPRHAIERMREAEEMEVFDNYVVLHFDPLGEGERLTAEEERRRRDPILFGVVREVRKLYFIADWQDEACALTMEVLIDKLGIKPSDVEMEERIAFDGVAIEYEEDGE